MPRKAFFCHHEFEPASPMKTTCGLRDCSEILRSQAWKVTNPAIGGVIIFVMSSLKTKVSVSVQPFAAACSD